MVAEGNVGNVKRTIGTEDHGCGEEQSSNAVYWTLVLWTYDASEPILISDSNYRGSMIARPVSCHPSRFFGRDGKQVFGTLFALLIASAVNEDSSTVGQWSTKTTWPYKAVHGALLPTGKVIWWPPFANGDNPFSLGPSDKHERGASACGSKHFLLRPCLSTRRTALRGRWTRK